MKQFLVSLVIIVVMLLPVAQPGRAHALVVAQPQPVFLCLSTLGCGPTPFFGPLCHHGHHWTVCHGHKHQR